MCPVSYCTMIRSRDHKYEWRLRMALHAHTHGIRKTARKFRCSRNTVRRWYRRFLAKGRSGLREISRAPKRCPHKTPPQVEARVLAARRRVPFGAARLRREFELPCSASAVARILRQAGLTRWRRTTRKRKRDLREIKKQYPPLAEWRLDTKYLRDIPHYWPQMSQRHLPRFQYTLREVRTGALFLAFGDELSATYAELTVRRLLGHLKQYGLDLTTVTIQTDNGAEYDGHTRRRRDRGFTATVEAAFAASHRFAPPSCPNANADVETVHSLIETEFYDLEDFADRTQFMEKTAIYQQYFNFGRPNSWKGNNTPFELLRELAPKLDPRILLLPPVDWDTVLTNTTNTPSQVGHYLPNQPESCRRAACSILTHPRAATRERSPLPPSSSRRRSATCRHGRSGAER